MSVVPYLVRAGDLPAAAVIDESLVVRDMSRRNLNYIVRAGATGFVVKQGVSELGEDAPAETNYHTIRYEGELYRFFEQVKGGEPLAPYLTKCIRYDNQERLLVLEFLHHAIPLQQHYLNGAEFDVEHAHVMAEIMASLHRISLEDAQAVEGCPLSRAAPMVLKVHDPHVQFARNCSITMLRLNSIIQSSPEICNAIDSLLDGWKVDGIVHNDVKFENFVSCAKAYGGERTELKLIDWESAALGDTSWDIGSMLGAYLGCWLQTMPVAEEIPPEQVVEFARYPLSDIQPAIRAFWESYVRFMEFSEAEASQKLHKCVGFAAARLIQSAIEMNQGTTTLTGAPLAMLQVAANMFARPQDAVTMLLGLETTLETAQ